MPAKRATPSLKHALATALAGLLLAVPGLAADDWRPLAPGLELGRFARRTPDTAVEAHIVVLRIDPARWDLRLGLASEIDGVEGLGTREWCRRQGYVAAINAGMFATDYLTHIGYLQHREHVNNPRLSRYKSVAAFCPGEDGIPPFRIFDTDDPGFAMDAVKRRYNCVVQNLRLLKRPGINRWQPQNKIWIEAALGEDRDGRALFIYSRTPLSMHRLNELLLALPLDIVCAQHLEGGPEAQIYVAVGGFRLEIIGGYETPFDPDPGYTVAWPLPNVIGVAPRDHPPPGRD